MAALSGKAFVQQQHPVYQALAPIWRKLAHAHEGTGGFADGTYLVPHPREWQDFTAANPKKPTKKLLERRALARYENWPKRIVKTFADTLFRQMPTRQVGGKSEKETPLEHWWEDVDGFGTHVDDFWPRAWKSAAIFGHAFLLVDRDPGTPTTAADARAPFVRAYTPLDAPDWLDDHGRLRAIKFLEEAPRASLEDAPLLNAMWTRYVTEEAWTLYDENGEVVSTGKHAFGCLPVVPLYCERRVLSALVGASLLGDPQLFIDYYNLISENRELLRKQTFSILNVPLGPDGNVETAKSLLGDSTGTDNVLFSALEAKLISPTNANTQAYRDERLDLLRNIFRLAGLQWEADSRDAEALGSLKLKREDMNAALAGYADLLEQADYAIAKLWYAATLGSERGAKAFDKDEVQIRYPETFDPTPFQELLEEAQAALTLGMGPTFKRELRKRLVEKFLPDLPADVLKAILTELEQQQDDDAGAGGLGQALLARLKDAGVTGAQAPKPATPPLPDDSAGGGQ